MPLLCFNANTTSYQTKQIEAAANVKNGDGERKGSGPKKKPVSRSIKVGLQFTVGRIGRYLRRGRYAQQVGTGTLVYMAIILENLAAESLINGESRQARRGGAGSPHK
ncbi:Histone H2A [Forsythia ovata]|uniref:Histone H2A n=1 Tax=Forsythia ovata TaxID=205694 RepID=A0ABD1PXI9_9LAMI